MHHKPVGDLVGAANGAGETAAQSEQPMTQAEASASSNSASQQQQAGITAAEGHLAAALQSGQAAHLQQAIRFAVRAIAAADPRLTSMNLVRTHLSVRFCRTLACALLAFWLLAYFTIQNGHCRR